MLQSLIAGIVLKTARQSIQPSASASLNATKDVVCGVLDFRLWFRFLLGRAEALLVCLGTVMRTKMQTVEIINIPTEDADFRPLREKQRLGKLTVVI